MRKLDVATLFPTFEPAWAKTVTWWQARSTREQWLLGLLGGLLALWLLAVTVILPIQRARAAALADIRTYENLTARLHSAGTIGASTPQTQASGPPNVILANTASQFGFLPVVNSDPAGLRVTVADAPYDALMRWIAAVEQTSSIRVTKMRLTRRPASGFVSADLLVRA
jgi:general secretion pathway protein M